MYLEIEEKAANQFDIRRMITTGLQQSVLAVSDSGVYNLGPERHALPSLL